MNTTLACVCGKKILIRAEHAGKNLKCPACGAAILAPQKAVAVAHTPVTKSPFDVFVSYSAKDKQTADALVARLETAGIRCWVAPRDITAGMNWSEGIITGIDACRVLVLIYSAHSNSSAQVVREVERAVGKGLSIVPFRIEAAPLGKAMEYFISSQHWLDALSRPIEPHLENLVRTLQTLLGRAEPRRGGSGSPANSVQSATSRPRRVLWSIAGVAALLALLLAYMLWPRSGADVEKLLAAQAAADVAWEKIKAIDPGDGFGDRIQRVEVRYRSAKGLLEQKETERALAAYLEVSEQCGELASLDRERVAAKAALEKTNNARSAAEAKRQGNESVTNWWWTLAEQSYHNGQKAFASGEFAKADRTFQQAEKSFDVAQRAAIEGKAADEARLAFLAELDGYDPADLERSAETWKKVQALRDSAETSSQAGEFASASEKFQQAFAMLPIATSIHKRLQAENIDDWDDFPLLDVRSSLQDRTKTQFILCIGELERLKIDTLSSPMGPLQCKGLTYERAAVRFLKAVSKDLVLAPRKGAHVLITSAEHATSLRKWDVWQYGRNKDRRGTAVARALNASIPDKVAPWIDFPLAECLEYLAQAGKIRLDVEWDELKTVNVERDKPLISLCIDGMTFEQALRACLEATSKDIGYVLEEDQVRISSWAHLAKGK